MSVREKPIVRGDAFAGRFRADGRTGILCDERGTPVIACPGELLAALQHTLKHDCEKSADAIMRAIGRRWGESLAERLDRELSQHHRTLLHDLSAAQVQASLSSAFACCGWGRVAWDWQRHDRGLLEISLTNGPASLGPERGEPRADHLLCGAFAGLFSRLTGENLDCLQTDYEVPESAPARFVVGLPERLGRAADAARRGQPHDQVITLLESIQV